MEIFVVTKHFCILIVMQVIQIYTYDKMSLNDPYIQNKQVHVKTGKIQVKIYSVINCIVLT